MCGTILREILSLERMTARVDTCLVISLTFLLICCSAWKVMTARTSASFIDVTTVMSTCWTSKGKKTCSSVSGAPEPTTSSTAPETCMYWGASTSCASGT